MYNYKVTRAFAICVILLIGTTFHVYGFQDWYSGFINRFDEGEISEGSSNAEDTCQASVTISKYESDWWLWVNTYESASVSTTAQDSKGNENVGTCSVWIRINAEDKGRIFNGADSIDNSDSKRRFFVSPGEVTVQARAQAWSSVDSDTKKVEHSF